MMLAGKLKMLCLCVESTLVKYLTPSVHTTIQYTRLSGAASVIRLIEVPHCRVGSLLYNQRRRFLDNARLHVRVF